VDSRQAPTCRRVAALVSQQHRHRVAGWALSGHPPVPVRRFL